MSESTANPVTLRERVAGERRRLKSVREALTTAVARKAQGDPAFVPYYLAIADYLKTSMDRLHAQDVKMGNLIRERLKSPTEAEMRALAELDERLAGNQRHLTAFVAARDSLRRDGAVAVPQFEAVSAAYTSYIVASMGHHGGSTDLAARLLSAVDWEYMAGITPAETATEQELYGRVFAAQPPALASP
jgi:hypothetical protein